MRIIVGITGASGVIYGIRVLTEMASRGVETHLIISRWARETIRAETDFDARAIESLATVAYDNDDLTAPVSSGSFITDGMVIAPCSMTTAAAVAHGYAENLISRAASVCLKEGRRLVILPRESPMSAIHLENLLNLARLGIIVLPPVPAFYSRPRSIDDLVDHTVGRVLDQFGIEHGLVGRWGLDCPGSGREQQGPGCTDVPQRDGGAVPAEIGRVQVAVGEGRFQISGNAWVTMGGIIAGLFGGDRPHVGSVVVSVPRPSITGSGETSCTSSVVNLLAHKEETVIRPLAEHIARVTGRPVVGVCGVHLDGATPQDIRLLVANCEEAGRRLVESMMPLITDVETPGSRDR
ncbi:MAG: UbiX family flavin prenyltransferase [Firmicutes bacterium]|nr:UbiX family flavin prenyltransferase [Bacillota bacterium]